MPQRRFRMPDGSIVTLGGDTPAVDAPRPWGGAGMTFGKERTKTKEQYPYDINYWDALKNVAGDRPGEFLGDWAKEIGKGIMTPLLPEADIDPESNPVVRTGEHLYNELIQPFSSPGMMYGARVLGPLAKYAPKTMGAGMAGFGGYEAAQIPGIIGEIREEGATAENIAELIKAGLFTGGGFAGAHSMFKGIKTPKFLRPSEPPPKSSADRLRDLLQGERDKGTRTFDIPWGAYKTPTVRPPQKLLPEAPPEVRAAATTTMYAGKFGVAPAGKTYPVDVSPTALGYPGQKGVGTLLPQETGEIIRWPAQFAAEHGTTFNAFTKEELASINKTNAERIFGALVPEKYKAKPPVTVYSEKPHRYTPEGELIAEEIVPSAPIRPRKRKTLGDKPVEETLSSAQGASRRVEKQIKKAEDAVGIEAKLNEVEQIGLPEINRVVQQVKESEVAKSKYRKWKESVGSQMTTRGRTLLTGMGEMGTRLSIMIDRDTHTRRQLSTKWKRMWEDTISGLSKTEKAQLPDVMEGTVKATGGLVEASKRARMLTEEMGRFAVEAEVRFQVGGNKEIPFRTLEFYWPHKYASGTFERPDIIDILVKQGMSRDRATKQVEFWLEYGEVFASPQYARSKNIPGYRKDLEAMREHIDQMASLVSRARHLGPGDISKAGSKVDLAIKAAENPTLAGEIAKTQLRKPKDTYIRQAARVVATAQLATKMSYHSISNASANVQTMLHSEGNVFVQSLGRILFNKKKAREIADAAGALDDISGSIVEEIARSKFSKSIARVYGVRMAEVRERTIAAGVGRGVAKILFKRLKGNPDSPKMMTKLRSLILEDDMAVVLRQSELTKEQLNYAAGRMSEWTQGLAEGVNLPMAWVNDDWLQIPLIFKKYAFQGTAAIWDGIKQHPVRNTAMLALFSQIMGEAVGDTKAVATGIVRGTLEGDIPGGIAAELEYRSEWPERITGTDNRIVNRMVNNVLTAWSLGLWADIASGLVDGKLGIAGLLLGPGFDQLANIVQGTGQALRGKVPTSLMRELKGIPFLGRGIGRVVLPPGGSSTPTVGSPYGGSGGGTVY